MAKVMLVEDDNNICNILVKYFENAEITIVVMNTGEDALDFLMHNSIDLIILDIMLPGIDGIEVCRKIREKDTVPVIMLTAMGESYDRINGLNIGADDYVVKPFDPNELVARANAMFRRSLNYNKDANESTNLDIMKFDNLIINKRSFEIYLDGSIIPFPRREFQLLSFLAENKNRVFSRSQLIESLWGWDFEGEDRVIDLYIKRIRNRINSDISKKWQITTIRGIGYKFEVK